ncbi:MAG: hypothetical protein H0U82_00280 [Actinobacteria bacterium]|nr:hypothetical protein [Actinomycetota bacterium]
MSMLERPSRTGRLSARRRRYFPRWLAFGLALVAVFAIGVAFGQALDDAPESGKVTTFVRTLEPLPQEQPVRTVTVTVTAP